MTRIGTRDSGLRTRQNPRTGMGPALAGMTSGKRDSSGGCRNLEAPSPRCARLLPKEGFSPRLRVNLPIRDYLSIERSRFYFPTNC